MHGQELNLLDKRTEGQKNKLALQILFFLCPSAKKGIYPGKPSISNVYNLIIVCKRISLEDAPTITSNVPAGSINCSFVVSQ